MRLCWLVGLALGWLTSSAGTAAAEAWATRDYIAAGVPDPGHPWSLTELDKAVGAITEAAADHPERLPRYRHASSGAVFARLIAEPRDDRAASIANQVGAHLARFDALNKAAKLYANGLGPPPREQIELFGVLLHESVALGALVEPFLASFPADDPSLPARRDGLAQFRQGGGAMMIGSLMIADNKAVPDADRLVVLRNLEETIAALLPVAPAAQQEAIRAYLAKLVKAMRGGLRAAAVRLQGAADRKP